MVDKLFLLHASRLNSFVQWSSECAFDRNKLFFKSILFGFFMVAAVRERPQITWGVLAFLTLPPFLLGHPLRKSENKISHPPNVYSKQSSQKNCFIFVRSFAHRSDLPETCWWQGALTGCDEKECPYFVKTLLLNRRDIGLLSWLLSS